MKINRNRKPVMAAEVDGNDIRETIDDLADSVTEVQDVVEEVSEDNPEIEVDNNIANHFIAERAYTCYRPDVGYVSICFNLSFEYKQSLSYLIVAYVVLALKCLYLYGFFLGPVSLL